MTVCKIYFFPEICHDFSTLLLPPNSSHLVLLYNRVLKRYVTGAGHILDDGLLLLVFERKLETFCRKVHLTFKEKSAFLFYNLGSYFCSFGQSLVMINVFLSVTLLRYVDTCRLSQQEHKSN